MTKDIEIGLGENYFRMLQNFDSALKYQLNIVKQKFQTIHPYHRRKRGLFNFLGTTIKAISGNLDEEDAKRYNQAISALEKNQKNIISNLNQHMSINTKLIDNFNETTTLIAHNQEAISEQLTKIHSKLDQYIFTFNHYMEIRNILDQLSVSLQLILQILTDLENAITFARTNILHNSVVKPEDIHWIVNEMLRNHKKEQILYIGTEDIPKYYDVIQIDAYYSNEMIIFILHFPLLHIDNFTHYHLYSIPTVNHTTIIPPSPYLTLNSVQHQYSDQPCRKLATTYICPSKSMQYNNQETDCVSQILQLSEEPALCNYVKISVTNPFVEQITEGYYIGIFPKPEKIATKCNTTSVQELQGTFLIGIPPGCEFNTKEGRFSNNKNEMKQQPLTLPKIRTISINQSVVINPIQLEKVPLDELHKIGQQEHQLFPIEYETIPDTTHFWTTPIFIITTIAIIGVVFKFYMLRKRRNKTTPNEGGPVLFVPPRTSSRDGGVTGHN